MAPIPLHNEDDVANIKGQLGPHSPEDPSASKSVLGADVSESRSGITDSSPPDPPFTPERSPEQRRASSKSVDREAFPLHTSYFLPIGCIQIGVIAEPLPEDWKELMGDEPFFRKYDIPCALDAMKLYRHRWIRIQYKQNLDNPNSGTARVMVLPDDVARRFIDRSDKNLRKCLRNVYQHLDVSSEAWRGEISAGTAPKRPTFRTGEDVSLFYLYNQLPSPAPDPGKVRHDRFSRAAIIRLLDPSKDVQGLSSRLYPYQRRSAAMMLQREVSPSLTLDPRLQPTTAPDNSIYYYDRERCEFLWSERTYEEARGGILAETMGLGKTLICLAVILSTKNHWPQIPIEYASGLKPRRQKVGSLMEMSAAAVGRYPVDWRTHFDRLWAEEEQEYTRCVEAIRENVGSYDIPVHRSRRESRGSIIPQGRKIILATGTIIVVPRNLLEQWTSEIQKHTDPDSLKVLIMDNNKKQLPPLDELLGYDILLFSRSRFEAEIKDGTDSAGRRVYFGASEADIYQSPLRKAHWKRLIVDEGHSMGSSSSSTKSHAIIVAEGLIVERRWIVSGTPAKGLIGIEVDLAAEEHSVTDSEDSERSGSGRTPDLRRLALERRRFEDAVQQERADLERLGGIVVNYLKVKPWCNPLWDDPAPWGKYIHGRKDPRDPGSLNSYCLKSTLAGLMVRHRPEDVEMDIELPPIYNKLVYLEPSYHDRLSINLFLMVIASNAITSEREDGDYLFHPKNRKVLNEFIANLRQSGFFWSGFTHENVRSTIDVSRGYLRKEDIKCSPEDRHLLNEAIEIGEKALTCPSWRAFSEYHEVGFYVETSEEKMHAFALDDMKKFPVLIGATQLRSAQQYVNEHLYAPDPSIGLDLRGDAAMNQLKEESEPKSKRNGGKKDGDELKKAQKSTIFRGDTSPTSKRNLPSPNKSSSPAKLSGLKSALKKTRPEDDTFVLPKDSRLAQTQILGCASRKLAYLIDRILNLQKEEKILVFYEGDNIAYYIAQALELVDVKYLIYAKDLPPARRAAYVVTFNTTETFRVLLMDVHQASHGLNMSTASRVFFVNPIWQPNVEAQAIKRAHRIGQKRPVFVETLILRDTLEDKMLQRRKAMTNSEHQQAEKSLLDDNAMSSIIQGARFLPLPVDHPSRLDEMARLETPQMLFARPTRHGFVIDDPDADLILPTGASKKKRTKRLQLATPDSESDAVVLENTTNPPRKKSKRDKLTVEQSQDSPDVQMATADDVEETIHVAMNAKRTKVPGKKGKGVRFEEISAAEAESSVFTTPEPQLMSTTTASITPTNPITSIFGDPSTATSEHR